MEDANFGRESWPEEPEETIIRKCLQRGQSEVGINVYTAGAGRSSASLWKTFITIHPDTRLIMKTANYNSVRHNCIVFNLNGRRPCVRDFQDKCITNRRSLMRRRGWWSSYGGTLYSASAGCRTSYGWKSGFRSVPIWPPDGFRLINPLPK